jgi:hypothetical protein
VSIFAKPCDDQLVGNPSKATVNYVKSLAKQQGPKGIRVNGVLALQTLWKVLRRHLLYRLTLFPRKIDRRYIASQKPSGISGKSTAQCIAASRPRYAAGATPQDKMQFYCEVIAAIN